MALLTKAKIDTDADIEVFGQISTNTDRTLNCQYRSSTAKLKTWIKRAYSLVEKGSFYRVAGSGRVASVEVVHETLTIHLS